MIFVSILSQNHIRHKVHFITDGVEKTVNGGKLKLQMSLSCNIIIAKLLNVWEVGPDY